MLDIFKTPTKCKTCFVLADKHLFPTGKREHALNSSYVPVNALGVVFALSPF